MPDDAADPLEKVAALLRSANNRGIELLEYSEGGMHLCVTFDESGAARAHLAEEGPRQRPVEAADPAIAALHSTAVLSPGVGIFRCALQAERGPVGEGSAVEAGAVVAMIQAGPLLQPVVAPRDGTLGRPLVSEGAGVGFGTALFELR